MGKPPSSVREQKTLYNLYSCNIRIFFISSFYNIANDQCITMEDLFQLKTNNNCIAFFLCRKKLSPSSLYFHPFFLIPLVWKNLTTTELSWINPAAAFTMNANHDNFVHYMFSTICCKKKCSASPTWTTSVISWHRLATNGGTLTGHPWDSAITM